MIGTLALALALQQACPVPAEWGREAPARGMIEPISNFIRVNGTRVLWNDQEISLDRLPLYAKQVFEMGPALLVLDGNLADCATLKQVTDIFHANGKCTPRSCLVSPIAQPEGYNFNRDEKRW